MYTQPKRNFLEHQYYNKSEQEFYKLHHYYPHEIYIMLLNMGFSSKAFEPIQKEIDRIYQLQKTESEFTSLNEYTGAFPF